MQADELDSRRALCSGYRTEGVTIAQIETELGVVLPGSDELVCVRLHTRGDAQCDPRLARALARKRLQPVEFVETVDVDVVYSGGNRVSKLGETLVVAVEDATVGRHTGRQSNIEFARRGDIEHQALFVSEPRHRLAEKGLGGIHDAVRAE